MTTQERARTNDTASLIPEIKSNDDLGELISAALKIREITRALCAVVSSSDDIAVLMAEDLCDRTNSLYRNLDMYSMRRDETTADIIAGGLDRTDTACARVG